jgi:rubrerythrin
MAAIIEAPRRAAPTIELDLDRVKTPEAALDAMGELLDPDGYDWSQATAVPLRADEVEWLTYATQIEWGTEHYFAVLDISKDPLVHRFLRVWLEQEVVHATVLRRLLEAHGVTVTPVHEAVRKRVARWRGKQINRLARWLIGDDFFAVHMTWGAVNELSTQRFYGVIRSQTANPLLREILRDIMAQEAAHYAFYRNVAIRRLTNSSRAQRITRWALAKLWTPVGVGLRTRRDADRIIGGILGSHPEVAAQMDAQIDRFPGLRGLALARRSLEHALVS